MFRRHALVAFALVAWSVATPPPATAGGPRPYRNNGMAVWDNINLAVPPALGGLGLAHYAGTGQVTHMGRTQQSGTLSLDFPIDAAYTIFPGHGTGLIIAANGDSVTYDYEGFFNHATGEGIGTFTFTGGTGRFADVTGGGTFDARVDASPTAQPMTFVQNGEISY